MHRLCTLVLGAALAVPSTLQATDAWGQSRTRASTTGIFARAGLSLVVLDPSSLVFEASRRDLASTTTRSFTGKQFGWGLMALPGLTLSVQVDARWFYVRVGADVFMTPAVSGQPDLHESRFATLGWIGAGPRYARGAWAFYGGFRIGALLMSVQGRNATDAEYNASDGLYSIDLGAQWRPTRWLELDVSVGHDFVSELGATTINLAASLGWTRRSGGR